MRKFTKEEKELIINTPITFDCFEMIDSFSDYDDVGLINLHSLYFVWDDLIISLDKLRSSYLETKNENYFIELIRLIPNSYKVVKL